MCSSLDIFLRAHAVCQGSFPLAESPARVVSLGGDTCGEFQVEYYSAFQGKIAPEAIREFFSYVLLVCDQQKWKHQEERLRLS